MKAIRIIQVALLLGFALLLEAASRIVAQPGYVAKGVVAAQPDGTLYVDTTPCAGAAYKRFVVFRAYYHTVTSNSVTCPGHAPYSQFVVYQDKLR